MFEKGPYSTKTEMEAILQVARGERPADLVVKNSAILDVFTGKFASGDLAVFRGMIAGTGEPYEGKIEVDGQGAFLVPGFIDAHVHIESSLLTPSRFQQAVLPCGTTTVIWDPHEIANVRGTAGLEWALAATEGLLLDVYIMVSSCVPSTDPALGLETSGAVLRPADLIALRSRSRVLGLAEMMNYPGVLAGESQVLDKLLAFQQMPRDGHCPGLTGKALNAYGATGIHSCHESITLTEAQEKLEKGIHVLIREGSCAKDADVLLPLLNAYTSAVIGLCSDDRHCADISREGHISYIIDKALRAGQDPAQIFRAASFATARAFGLRDRGVLAPGFLADFCVVQPNDRLNWRAGFHIDAVYKRGQRIDPAVLDELAAGRMAQEAARWSGANIRCPPCSTEDFAIASPNQNGRQRVRVIGIRPRQLRTDHLFSALPIVSGKVMASENDIVKIAVFERHHGTGWRAVGFVKGFGLRAGAIATSIGHDAHNAMVLGASDQAMAMALNHLRAIDGGIVVVEPQENIEALSLPIGGLMCDRPPQEVARALESLKRRTRALGCTLEDPFLQLSFLALPVIPTLKITDRGLVDVESSQVVSLVAA